MDLLRICILCSRNIMGKSLMTGGYGGDENESMALKRIGRRCEPETREELISNPR